MSKSTIKRALSSLGWSVRRVPSGVVVGHDLPRDLAIVMGPRPDPACIDVGANVGDFVELLKTTLREPRIHAFEPAPEPFARLKERYGRDPRVWLNNAGLGAGDGQLNFNIYDNQTLNSALPISEAGTGTLGGPKLLRTTQVPVLALDGYADSRGIERIDLLKIDTQGFELQVLRGSEHLLAARRVSVVLLELNFVPLYEGQVAGHEVMAFLSERGFGLVDFYEKCRLNPFVGWCTALFALRPLESK